MTTSFYEAYLRAARQRQQTDEFKQLYRLRPRIEGKQAELVSHGLHRTRYLGKPKRRLQRLWLAAAVNLQRMFKLTEIRASYLTTLLTPVCEANMTAVMVYQHPQWVNYYQFNHDLVVVCLAFRAFRRLFVC